MHSSGLLEALGLHLSQDTSEKGGILGQDSWPKVQGGNWDIAMNEIFLVHIMIQAFTMFLSPFPNESHGPLDTVAP